MAKIRIRSAVLVLAAIQLIFAGCQKPVAAVDARGGQYSIADLAALQTTDCLSLLRTKMKANRLSFDATVSSKIGYDIEIAQKISQSLDSTEPNYVVSRGAENKTTNLSISRSDSTTELEVELSLGEEKSGDLFVYKISLASKAGNLETDYEQQFKVDQACKARLSTTAVVEKSTVGSAVHIKKVELYPGEAAGSLQKTEERYERPNGLLPLEHHDMPTTPESLRVFVANNLGNTFFSVEPGVGIITAKLKDVPPTEQIDPLTGKVGSFENLTLIMSIGGSEVAEMKTSFSTSSKFVISQLGDVPQWRVNEKFWDGENLVSDAASANEVHVPSGLMEKSGSALVLLESNRPYGFENLAAYWTMQAAGDIKSEWAFVTKIMSVPNPTELPSAFLIPESSRNRHPFLKPTLMVQSDSLEVKKLALKLQQFLHESRYLMARRIADIVTSELTYDYSSLDKGEIYALSTNDVLTRKTGVCQHFANLFAALGRSVGLPTRIVVGFSIGENTATPHAWNEIEISDGVWLPIEPQSKDLFIRDGAYLPSAVSTLLETGVVSNAEIQNSGLLRFKYSLLERMK